MSTQWWKVKGEKVDDKVCEKRQKHGSLSFAFVIVLSKIWSYLRNTDPLMTFFNNCEVFLFGQICRIAFTTELLLLFVAFVEDYPLKSYKSIFITIFVMFSLIEVGLLVSYYYGYMYIFNGVEQPLDNVLYLGLGVLSFLVGMHFCWRDRAFIKSFFKDNFSWK